MTRTFSGLGGFATFIAGLALEVEHAKHKALEEAAEFVERESKALLGTYDLPWPQLAQSTQEQRARLGYPENEPGLRSGAMRDTISHTVGHDEAVIGSDDPNLVYFELGTSRQPPRPVLMGAATSKGKEIEQILGEHVVRAIK